MATASLSFLRQCTSIYRLSSISSLSPISIRFSSIYFFPISTSSGFKSFSTCSPYSLLPIKAPSAIAMGSPTIFVPGIPTPIAFFNMLALRYTFIFSGTVSNTSVALATHSETAIGSVHPIAGTTSFLIKLMIRLRSHSFSMLI